MLSIQEKKMSNPDYTTSADPETLANEVACLKATLTLLLKAIGQADAGKVILNIERSIAGIEDAAQAEVFTNTVAQIKNGYRQ
jgi:hypothetical protein